MSDEEIYQEVERTVYDMVQPLSLGLKRMQENLHAIDSQIDSRISSLETGVKQISIPSSVHGNDDEKIYHFLSRVFRWILFQESFIFQNQKLNLF